MEQGPYLRSPERSLALSVVVEAALNFRGLEALLWQGLWVLSPGSVSGKLNVFNTHLFCHFFTFVGTGFSLFYLIRP